MTDKAHEGQKQEDGCCGSAAKTTAESTCSTDKKAQPAEACQTTEKKSEKSGCCG